MKKKVIQGLLLSAVFIIAGYLFFNKVETALVFGLMVFMFVLSKKEK